MVVPTRDRWPILRRTLGVVAARAGEVGGLELVVVDDGSRDATVDELSRLELPGCRLRALRQPPRGPAAARNLGIAAARADRILLLGDDTPPAPGCLVAHLQATDGLQGPLEWDPGRTPTAVMRFLAPAGPQFWFRGLADGEEIPPTAVLGSNFSAPRVWFELEPFDEGFPDAAFEDTEIGWRFAQRGWRSRWLAAALCWHDHVYDSLEPFLDRQQRAGRAARRALGLHPALAWVGLLKPLAVLVAKSLGVGRRPEPERTWELRCLRSYLGGLLAGGRRSAPTAGRVP